MVFTVTDSNHEKPTPCIPLSNLKLWKGMFTPLPDKSNFANITHFFPISLPLVIFQLQQPQFYCPSFLPHIMIMSNSFELELHTFFVIIDKDKKPSPCVVIILPQPNCPDFQSLSDFQSSFILILKHIHNCLRINGIVRSGRISLMNRVFSQTQTNGAIISLWK